MSEIIDLDQAKQIKEKVLHRRAKEAEENKEPPSGLPKKFVMDCLNSGEFGDGVLYIALHDGKFIKNANSDEMFVFNGTFWELDKERKAFKDGVECVVTEYAKHVPLQKADGNPSDLKTAKILQKKINRKIKRLRTTVGQNNTIIQATRGANSLLKDLDKIRQDPMLFACPNCIIDLETGAARRGKPSDYIFKGANVEYHGVEISCPTWENSLLKIMAGNYEMVDFLQRILGMSLIAAVVEHKFFQIHGPTGRNGKTTIFETVGKIFGELAGPMNSEIIVESWRPQNSSAPTPDILWLRHKLMAWLSELKQNAIISCSKLKLFTGDDSLVARGPYDKYEVRFRPTHTLFLLTNHLGRLDGQDDAVWSRMLKIPLTERFLNDPNPDLKNEHKLDPTLTKKLEKELVGILGWLVRGCLLYQKYGLNPPHLVTESTKEYRSEENFYCGWKEDCVFDDPTGEVLCSEAYQNFDNWYQENIGGKTPTPVKFRRWARPEFNPDNIRMTNTRGERVYRGIGLRKDLL